MDSFDYDLIVIGGGSGGYAAASGATAGGLSVAVVESAQELGGLCILRGCMPTKALLETSQRMRDIREAGEFGIKAAAPELDLDALRSRKSALVDGFQHYRKKGLTSGRFELIRGSASFSDQRTIVIDGEKRLSAKYFVVATGSEESIPPISGLAETPYWTSDDIVTLPSIPKRVVVIGTGAVGLESAFLFEGFGSEVTILSRSRPLLSGIDDDISAAMEKRCADLGMGVVFEDTAQEVSHQNAVFTIHLSSGRVLEADQVIVATGRKPRLDGLQLENAGFAETMKRIDIDGFSRSSVPHIFAAGDCASELAVVHLAVTQGEVAAEAICALEQRKEPTRTWDPRLNIFGIFSDPEIVQVGPSEQELKKAGRVIRSEEYRYDDQGKGEIVGEKHGLVKIVIDAETREILSASGMGPHVIDYAHTMLVAIHQRLTIDEFIKIPAYHPTLGEIWSYAAEEFLD